MHILQNCLKMEHRAVMKSTSGQSSGGDCCNNNLSGSSLFKASVSSLFNKGHQHKDDFQLQYAPKKGTAKKSPRSSIESTGTCDSNRAQHPQAEQPTIRAQEIPQRHSLEQRFLSKMRESGVVTSAGYKAVLHDFLTSDRDLHKNTNNNTSPAEEVTPTSEGVIDRRAEMLKARKRSSRRGSSRRFGSFFTACASSYNDDEDLFIAAAAEAFDDDNVPDRTTTTLSSVNNNDDVTDRRAEFINSGRKGSSRRGSTRLFGSFFTACTDDHDTDFDFNASYRNCTAENIAPLRRSNSSQKECFQSSSVEKEEEVASVVDHHDQLSSCSPHWSIASSLSDSIHIVNSDDDDDDELRLERCEGKNVALERQDSCNSLNLEDIFDGSQGSHVMKPTRSSSSISEQQEQRKSSLESPESSSSTLDECGWLPWPEQKKDCNVVEGEIIKDDESDIAVMALYGDDEFSFLPWPDTPKNGRATAA